MIDLPYSILAFIPPINPLIIISSPHRHKGQNNSKMGKHQEKYASQSKLSLRMRKKHPNSKI
jgi:hypothetical protein